MPPAMDGVEGVLTMIIDVLSQNGVHAIDASLSGEELSLILREDDAGRAFESLRALSR